MSLTGVFIRFFLLYVAVVVLVGTALRLFSGASSSGLNIAILAGSVFWCCSQFVQANQRWFTGKEQLWVITGFTLINLLVQAGFALVIAGAASFTHQLAVWGALLVVSLLHLLVIVAALWLARRTAKKQLQQADLLAAD